jgi:hypothetical protein
MYNRVVSERYNQALHEAQAELQKLDERRTALLRLIECLKVLSGDDTYELTPPPGYVPMGLTDEIRKILEITTIYLEPVQIRDSLIQRGVQHTSPKNLLINVHTVLDRIEKELDKFEKDSKTAYRMKDVYRSGMRGMGTLVDPTIYPPAMPPPPSPSRVTFGEIPTPPKRGELPMEPPPAALRQSHVMPRKLKKE